MGFGPAMIVCSSSQPSSAAGAGAARGASPTRTTTAVRLSSAPRSKQSRFISCAGRFEVCGARDNAGDLAVGDVARDAVGAEQEGRAVFDLEGVQIDLHVRLGAERAADDVAARVVLRPAPASSARRAPLPRRPSGLPSRAERPSGAMR